MPILLSSVRSGLAHPIVPNWDQLFWCINSKLCKARSVKLDLGGRWDGCEPIEGIFSAMLGVLPSYGAAPRDVDHTHQFLPEYAGLATVLSAPGWVCLCIVAEDNTYHFDAFTRKSMLGYMEGVRLENRHPLGQMKKRRSDFTAPDTVGT
ncbi:hypothetical protein DENSPDRAFT_835753 [Dentipellis sp. KUC8613]|nr:hypothetical protein DENSPDRAFT_835753 [Dentipellis sp. KUC8613]